MIVLHHKPRSTPGALSEPKTAEQIDGCQFGVGDQPRWRWQPGFNSATTSVNV